MTDLDKLIEQARTQKQERESQQIREQAEELDRELSRLLPNLIDHLKISGDTATLYLDDKAFQLRIIKYLSPQTLEICVRPVQNGHMQNATNYTQWPDNQMDHIEQEVLIWIDTYR